MFTILTPTYNRAYILSNAYESLCRQSNKQFEWIIVDDGSEDDTETLVVDWMRTGQPFPIRYVKQENGGKHRAVNRGVGLASTEYVLILDSDDYLLDDASECIHRWMDSIDGLPEFAGVSGLKGIGGEPVGGFLDKSYIDATNLERCRFGLGGDKAEIYKTEIMRKYPFPEFDGENFLPESASWDRIARDGYKLRWFNRIIYNCAYLEDGLTKSDALMRFEKNLEGQTYCARLFLETHGMLYRCFKIGQFAMMAEKIGLSDDQICARLEIGEWTLLRGKLMFTLKESVKKLLKPRG